VSKYIKRKPRGYNYAIDLIKQYTPEVFLLLGNTVVQPLSTNSPPEEFLLFGNITSWYEITVI